MKLKILFFILFIFMWQQLVLAQNKTSFDAYKAEADGYFINFSETDYGIVATDNHASNIYLFKDGNCKVLLSAPGCGRYMTLSPDKRDRTISYIRQTNTNIKILPTINNFNGTTNIRDA